MMRFSRILAHAIVICAVLVSPSFTQTFETLVSFNGSNGFQPLMSLVQGWDGNLYGTTEGVCCQSGTVFKMSPFGQLTTMYTFCSQASCPDGYAPQAGLVLGTDGTFYGTTSGGGANLEGTVFKITSEGQLTTLYSFCAQPACSDGAAVTTGVIQGIDGNLYGTTNQGGLTSDGTVFRLSRTGVLTTLYSFCSLSDCADGRYPSAGLIQASDGNFYGTTVGTVFKISTKGALTTLYSFCSLPGCTDGAGPEGLVQGTEGNFYGTTISGGTNNLGTVFKLTPQGSLTTLHSFCTQANCADGSYPQAGLIQASDGNFYGATNYGGIVGCYENAGCGTIFKINSAGMLTTLHSFDGTDGDLPEAALVQNTNGIFYGATFGGGANCCGSVYGLSTGLRPFVAFVQRGAKIGQTAEILGQGLKGASSVSFNGKAANFTVRAETLLTAIVPTGATTGYVTVTTPSGTLKSDVTFQVIP